MRTVQEKLNSLTPKSIWYFAKQDANFNHTNEYRYSTRKIIIEV